MRREKHPPIQMALGLQDPQNSPPPAPQSPEVVAALADLLLRAARSNTKQEVKNEPEG